jgi:hypothetical protein
MYGKTSSGIGVPPLVSTDGKLIVQNGGGKYADAAINGRLFCAAMQTPTTTSTTLNTTFVGLGLCNPTGSGKLIIVYQFSWATTGAITAEALLALATTTDSGFAVDITPRCCRYNYATSVAIVDKAATIVAPVIERPITTLGQGAATVQQMMGWQCAEIDGSIVLAPGRALVTDTTVAVGAVMQFGYVWEEVNLIDL